MSKRPRKSIVRRAGQVAEAGDKTLRSYAVGAVPIINHLLQRMRLAEILQRHLPPDDGRTKVPTFAGLLLLLRNVLISREPVYGVADWACGYAPDLLGLVESQLTALNDDRLGRCLGGLFASLVRNKGTRVKTGNDSRPLISSPYFLRFPLFPPYHQSGQ